VCSADYLVRVIPPEAGRTCAGKDPFVDFKKLLADIRSSPDYRGQVVHVREEPAREARFADLAPPLPAPVHDMLAGRGVARLYAHQAEAVGRIRSGENVVVATGTASGKSLCYQVPLIEALTADPETRALLLFPTKALCQDQFKGFREALDAAGLDGIPAGVFDGDTPSELRRRLRDEGRVVFTNPDMLHAAFMPQHGRWADFLARLRILVLDELHVYSGIFGSNMVNLMRRFRRVYEHYGADPQFVCCSATIANPKELAERVMGAAVSLVDDDGSPRGRRTVVFWNPPRIRRGAWRSRRSANVEAHELMAMLIRRDVPTITFSKAKMTAEMIHRYVRATLAETAPQLASKVSPYRGGYRPAERREIERRLFSGELMGVSATSALELGIDVGGLDASILVGYPGTLASFFQQSGRAGRRDRDALVVLVGLDTAVNQYVMSFPDYIFGRPVEQAVLDPDNPFVVTGHLRCAAHELPLSDGEKTAFGPHAGMVLNILQDNLKVRSIEDRWYHAATETPQHEFSLRDTVDANVLIEEADSGEVLGEINVLDAPPILHPEAIYIHRGDTYRVIELNLEKNVATVKREDVDYYTQPMGGTDVHHVDHRLREKSFGSGKAYWGEVTAYFRTTMYEKVRFYELDAISRHGLDLPTFSLETMAVWIVPPESLMEEVRMSGLDAHSGLRGIGYATRMILPLFMTCDTRDFSHSIGSVNSEWNAVFIYERYPHGLGFTEKAYERLHEILPAVRASISACACREGCPCCVGKPLRGTTTWNPERGEASIPAKAAALAILEGLMKDEARLRMSDAESLAESSDANGNLRLERALRRRLERMREPKVFHPINPNIRTAYPAIEDTRALAAPDIARRAERRVDFDRAMHKRLAKKIRGEEIAPMTGRPAPPPGMKRKGANLPPSAFPGKPVADARVPLEKPPLPQGDPLAALARRRAKRGRHAKP